MIELARGGKGSVAECDELQEALKDNVEPQRPGLRLLGVFLNRVSALITGRMV